MSLIEKAVFQLDKEPPSDTRRSAPVTPDGHAPSAYSAPGMAGGDLLIAPPVETENLDETAQGITVDVPLESLRERGMVTPDGSNIGVSSEFRVIKRPILDAAFPKRGAATIARANTVMVTSSAPGEGKSFCAMNLALSIAMERDHRVLLIDSDVHRPNVMKTLGVETQLESQPGLIDAVLDPAKNVVHSIHKTTVENLFIMPVGARHSHPTELFSSKAMDDFIEHLSVRFANTVIIFDCCPLLATTEARVLAPRIGQVLVVVEADRTPRDRVKESLACLESANVVGLVLNKSKVKNTGEYYGYYYAA